MNIVVEGPDNSGKSTLARKIAQVTGKKLMASYGKPVDIPARIAQCMLESNAVFDRHPCVSDMIYSAARRDPPIVTLDDRDQFYKQQPLIIYCAPGPISSHTAKEGEDLDHVQMVQQRHYEIVVRYQAWALEKANIIYRMGDDLPRVLTFIEEFDPVEDVHEFMDKFGQTYEGPPRALPVDLSRFREDFMDEELGEYKRHARALEALLDEQPVDQAAITHHLAEMLDAIMDKLYVDIGTALLHGFNSSVFREAWRRVHTANMKKERVAKRSDSTRYSLYDVIKPSGWTAPDHKDLVEGHAHR